MGLLALDFSDFTTSKTGICITMETRGLHGITSFYHRSNFGLIFQNYFPQKVLNIVMIVPNIVLGSIAGNLLLRFSYSIQTMSLQPSRKRSNTSLWSV